MKELCVLKNPFKKKFNVVHQSLITNHQSLITSQQEFIA